MKAVAFWFLIGCLFIPCAVAGAQGEASSQAAHAPPHVIQAFRLRFQQRNNRWGYPDPQKMSAILKDLDVALKKYPSDPVLQWWYATALRELGRYGDAAEKFREMWQSEHLMRHAAFPFFLASLWQDGQYRRAWQYLKPYWARSLWQRVEPTVTTAALAVVTFFLFWKRPEAKRLLVTILALAGILFMVQVTQFSLAWAIQGYPLMITDYPPGGWVAVGTGVIVWLLFWLAARLLGTAPRTARGISPVAPAVFSLFLMGSLTYVALQARWADLRLDKIPLIAQSATIPFMLYGVLNATVGAVAKGRFMVLTLYASLREAFGKRWGEVGIALAWVWFIIVMVLSGGIPQSYIDLRQNVLVAGWGIAAALVWEAYPTRWTAYLPYTLSALLRTVISAFVSLGGVVR